MTNLTFLLDWSKNRNIPGQNSAGLVSFLSDCRALVLLYLIFQAAISIDRLGLNEVKP